MRKHKTNKTKIQPLKRLIVPIEVGGCALIVNPVSARRIVLFVRTHTAQRLIAEIDVERALALQFALHEAISAVEEDANGEA